MQRMYFCPNCRAPVAYGYRFCSSCGVKLEWLIQQMTPKSSSYDHALVVGDQKRYQRWHMENNQPSGSATKPMRTEILKLLTELLDKQIKYN